MHDYTQQDISNALKNIGISKGDILFSHSNVGFFGIPKGLRSHENIFNTLLDGVFDVIGAEGTLVVPTFTYSHSNGLPFDVDNTPSTCGFFTEMLRKHPGACRSLDANISVAAIGQKAMELTQNLPQNSYGEDSFFDRFYKANGIICNFNFDAGSTFIHYVERCLKVPYRYDKTFEGMVIQQGKIFNKKSIIWVRDLELKNSEANFEKFNSLAVNTLKYKKCNVGRGMIGAISAKDTFELIKQNIKSSPNLLLQKTT
ncbi:N-acetyltransferase [Thalassotalea insulae]|uniref:Aminoglycoside N(3)-acetyltransferase n=1 Tax=Thalassotalea insulae TaxID=2056778 RepID=A0ABQ6GSM3_9GAMM|nr:AAC(3) family N-acetyltransferase [Thalassotalea insulae]GLX77642.1 N-acetyltransferase [Thalassotalea insulae]